MGLGKRLFDLARSNLSALLRREDDPENPGDLRHFDDEELEAELRLRRDRRRRQEESRAAREAAERAARERARTSRTASGASQRTASSSSSKTSSSSSKAASAPSPERARLEALYARLETPYGADLPTLKQNFRRLLRQHHPDLAGGSPEKQRAATERTTELTTAFNELEAYLAKSRPPR